jgi:hypothetical protein
MVRAVLLCFALPACLSEAPDPPRDNFEIVFTITAPSSFDSLVMILPAMPRATVSVDPASSEYVWDYRTYELPDSVQIIGFLDGVAVGHESMPLTYSFPQTPNGTFTFVLHP